MGAGRRGRMPAAWFALARRMVAHARAAWPNECCGLIARDARGRSTTIRARNTSKYRRFSYSLDPAAFFWAAQRGLEPVGVYHSHVEGGTRPYGLTPRPGRARAR
jgi:proteasome lid subunit RPN8/RPN11